MRTKVSSSLFSLFLFVFLLSPAISVQGQIKDSIKVLRIGTDTLIALTPRQLRVVNSIVTDREFLDKENKVLKNINKQYLGISLRKDSVITEQEKILKKQEEYYTQSANHWNKLLKNEQKKKKWIVGTLGTVTVIITGILLGSLVSN